VKDVLKKETTLINQKKEIQEQELMCPKCLSPDIVHSDVDKDIGKLFECMSCHFCQTIKHFKRSKREKSNSI
jgi:hypothetical protein